MKRKIWGTAPLALALTFAMSGVASADVTIGSTTQPSGSSGMVASGSSLTLVQVSSASFPVGVPARGGQITSWSTNTLGSTPGAGVELVVLRPTGSGNFTVIAVDSRTLPTPLPASGVATFNLASPISVQAGDQIGLQTSGNALIVFDGGTTPSTDTYEGLSSSPPAPPATGQTLQPATPTQSGIQVNLSAFVRQPPDVGVTTSTAPARPSVGNLAVLQSSVTSSEPGDAVTFTDSVPAGLSIDSAVAGGGSCSVSGQTVSCTIPSVTPGSSVPVDVLVTPRATGNYTNNVSVAPPTGFTDPNPANNTATATLNVGNTAPSACAVPKLRGTPVGVAKRVLKQLGCKVKIKRKKGRGVPKGTVLKTKPKPGTYALGRKITLIVRK